ncbi:G-protein coupled receptor 35 [Heterocephalus glaber]|uniref:G-protein coupled receptor 35 n=1 Tax=Heterocephalus glaber TaxID=10181 RepID=A0AAX6S3B5_HETGA|nr:G-protein coupled receptor 35 [Heterocephalus glaber]XP_004868500.1 G-protein coupled receptor 35 [Heterocephalus glaber]XP_004868501.1 G-protein coupled receptor 35 [Heterocephalus glaber]XP_021102974.1 G-protein coupled receptor 35 [Heterocephalus glaber]
MNGTCQPPTGAYSLRVFIISYSAVLLVLGLLLNGLALWVFCRRMPQWTETRVYMTNLAVSDFFLLCSLPFMLLSLKDTEDTLQCRVSQAVYMVNRYMSISLVMAIAVDRYLAVRHPLRARGLRSLRQAVAVCLGLWVLVVGSLLVRLYLGQQEGGFCFRSYSRHNFSSTTFSLVGFYLPLAILVFCSLQVVTVLAQSPATETGQAESTHKAARMIWANLIVFVVCFLPLHVVLTVQVAMSPSSCAARQAFSRALSITSQLSNANCCLDAICYYYMAKEFQEASVLPTSHRSQESQSLSLSKSALPV